MPYTLNNGSTRTDFVSGRNILASEHLEYVKGGATLDAASFGAAYIPVGTLIARNRSTGLYEAFDAEATELPEGFDNFSIMNIDATSNGEDDIVLGEVIVRGSVYVGKLPTEVPAVFRAATPMIQYIEHL